NGESKKLNPSSTTQRQGNSASQPAERTASQPAEQPQRVSTEQPQPKDNAENKSFDDRVIGEVERNVVPIKIGQRETTVPIKNVKRPEKTSEESRELKTIKPLEKPDQEPRPSTSNEQLEPRPSTSNNEPVSLEPRQPSTSNNEPLRKITNTVGEIGSSLMNKQFIYYFSPEQIDATAVNAQYSASIMECASASDSDCDSVTLGPDGTIRECDSDSDEAPCETQPLWRAGVYTAEEAVSEARSALVSLQQAYTRQLSRLRVLLQTHRGNYLRALKAEKETYCSINAQARSGPLTVRERRQLRKLKAYAAHHRRHGMDAVLARKLTHKRAKQGTEPSNRPIPSQSRCTYTEESVRCGNPVLPASKHCLKHILHDSNQVLFVPCSSARGVGACREAVPLLPAAPLCRYHAPVPAHQVFHMRKDESKDGSESEVTSDASEPGPSEPVLSEPILSEIPARSAITSAALQDIMFQ
ncbi:KAT8 regulatory NSL complex subunit 2-like, partial [Ostrinia furnacalis]|uniref:KAT8 regulatory NSL complex subunit 2-like n=1 Tax=Ostrinia furnacalis TaxID=93504 RepID=UPI001038F3B4